MTAKRPPSARYHIELVGLTMNEVCTLRLCMSRALKEFKWFNGKPTQNMMRQVLAQADSQFAEWFEAKKATHQQTESVI